VVCVVRHGQRGDAGDGLDGPDMDGVFVEVRVARTVAVDVFPCLRRVEVEFVWGDSNYGAILVVEELVVKGETAFKERFDAGDGTKCV